MQGTVLSWNWSKRVGLSFKRPRYHVTFSTVRATWPWLVDGLLCLTYHAEDNVKACCFFKIQNERTPLWTHWHYLPEFLLIVCRAPTKFAKKRHCFKVFPTLQFNYFISSPQYVNISSHSARGAIWFRKLNGFRNVWGFLDPVKSWFLQMGWHG